MKNKEKYFNEILEAFINKEECAFKVFNIYKRNSCSCISCDECAKKIKQWLEEECTEPIVLTQFEYDSLSCCDENKRKKRFNYYTMCMQLKNKGYYKGVYDVKMTIEEILDNCEIVK